MLAEIDFFAIERICLNMRQRDAEEIYNLLAHDNPLQFAAEATHMIRNMGRGRVAWHNARPTAVAAFTECRPGVWDVWMFGTDDFKHCVFEMLRWIRKEVPDILNHAHGHLLQAHSRAGYDEAHAMIRAMGGKQEGPPLRRYGKDGSDYLRFVWLREEHDGLVQHLEKIAFTPTA